MSPKKPASENDTPKTEQVEELNSGATPAEAEPESEETSESGSAPRKTPGVKEPPQFAWKVIGKSGEAIITLFKSVEREEVEDQYKRLSRDGYYTDLEIVDISHKTVQPESVRAEIRAALEEREEEEVKPVKKSAAKAEKQSPKKKVTAKKASATSKKKKKKETESKKSVKAKTAKKTAKKATVKKTAKKATKKTAKKTTKTKVTTKKSTKAKATKKKTTKTKAAKKTKKKS